MAKVKIGLIKNRFVTNPKLIPKSYALQKLQGWTCDAAMQSVAGIVALRVFRCEIQPAFMSLSGNTSKCRTRVLNPN
jgi:hypothetical protein